MPYRPDVMLGNGPMVTDEVFLMEVWKPAISVSKPFRTDATYPMFEGGYVDSVDVDGVTVTLESARTRQAIDPADGSASYATSLTKDHTGRNVLVWTGNSAGVKATIVDQVSAHIIELDKALDLSAGDLLIICDEVKPESMSANWDIDQYSAGADFGFQCKEGDAILRMSTRSVLYWRKRAFTMQRMPVTGGPMIDTGWCHYGFWVVSAPQDDLRDATMPLRVTCVDMLKASQVEPVVATFQADILKQYGNHPTQTSMQVLKLVQDGSGDDAMWRFFDSPESNDFPERVLANHTYNWCSQWPIELWMSADTNPYVTRTGPLPDLPVNLTDGVIQALYGNGEIRITDQWYKANMSSTGPGIGAISFNLDQRLDTAVPPGWSSPVGNGLPAIMGWLRLDHYPSVGTYMSIAGLVFLPATDAANMAYIDSDGHLCWESHLNFDTFTVVSSSAIPLDGEFHHIAAGVDDTGQAVGVWIDGTRVGTTSSVDPILSAAPTGCVVGKIDQGENPTYTYLSGAIDEFLWIYATNGRAPMSDAAVAADYNSGSGTTTHSLNADDYLLWHFDGNLDSSIAGTFINGPPVYCGGKLGGGAPAGRAYLKIRYAKWCGDGDVRLGVVTGLSGGGTIVSCSGFTGALELPDPGAAPYIGMVDRTLRFTSGLARGATFTILDNDATTVTLDRSASAEGAATDDEFEIGRINDPVEVLETSLLMSGYQVGNDELPMFVAPLEPALQPDTAESIQYYVDSVPSWTDLTSTLANESMDVEVALVTDDLIAVGNQFPYSWLYFNAESVLGVEDVVHEYWNGTTWATIPALRYDDQTADIAGTLAHSGYIHFNRPDNWELTTINGIGPLFYTRLRGTGAGGAATLRRIQVLARSQFKSPTQFVLKDNHNAQAIFGDCRSQRVLPPNWVLRADTSGAIRGQAVVQQAATWEATSVMGMRHVSHDSDIITAATYTGYSENRDNLAIGGRTIPGNTEVISIIDEIVNLAPADISTSTVNVPTNDHTNGINGLIRGLLKISSDPDPAGGYLGAWQAVRTGSDPAKPISQVPLWTLDLGGTVENLNEVHLYTNNDIKPHEITNQSNSVPTLALQVSDDYLTWYPLCSTASTIALKAMGQNGFLDSRFTSREAGFQSSWRYLRCVCAISGWYAHSGTTYAHTGCCLGVRIYQNQQLTVTVKMGVDAPFMAQEYTDRARRYGTVMDLSSEIDYSADSTTKVWENAVARLKEYSFQLPELVLDVLRPDAQLFESCAVTWPRYGYDERAFMILGLSANKGADVSAKVRDCTVRSVS